MNDLLNAIKLEKIQSLNDFIDTINSVEILSGLSSREYTELLPKGKIVSKLSLIELKAYLIGRKEKTVYKWSIVRKKRNR